MSYSLSIQLRLGERPLSYVGLIRVLLSSGWTADNTVGGIHYGVTDQNGDVDARSRPVGELESILRVLSSLEAEGKWFAISLFWAGTDYGIRLAFNDVSNDVLGIGYDLSRRVLQTAPPVTDHNWYLDRILPPLIAAGCTIRSLKWEEAP